MISRYTKFLPTWLIRVAIDVQLKQRLKLETKRSARNNVQDFIDKLCDEPIAIATDDANNQHYMVPPEFYRLVLGPCLKYSCCYYENESVSLADAEVAMLALYCERAGIQEGQKILDLGCGWGSFALYAAQQYPNSTFTALSNSSSQRQYIESRVNELGLENVNVITGNIVDFEFDQQFDRIVSIEMFEHMRNYRRLLKKVTSWLDNDGKLFLHFFCHREFMYEFDDAESKSWMARNFFTNGMMPSVDLMSHFPDLVKVVDQWNVNGKHYAKTSYDWVKNLHAHKQDILSLFVRHYGKDYATAYFKAWEIFFLSCALLFGYNDGKEWLVTHVLLEKSEGV